MLYVAKKYWTSVRKIPARAHWSCVNFNSIILTLLFVFYYFVYLWNFIICICISKQNCLISAFLFFADRNEGQPCSSRLSLPFGFESRCRQKYIKKKLLSLNADGQGTSEDNFFIPSCCVCEITRLNKRK